MIKDPLKIVRFLADNGKKTYYFYELTIILCRKGRHTEMQLSLLAEDEAGFFGEHGGEACESVGTNGFCFGSP